MNKRFQFPVLLIAMSLSALAAAGESHLEARRLVDEGVIRPLDEIMAEIHQQHPGRILEAELERKREVGYTYEIELLDEEGVVWELKVDATNGELLHVEPEE
jgi:uncharacterized membrane protein YkoI